MRYIGTTGLTTAAFLCVCLCPGQQNAARAAVTTQVWASRTQDFLKGLGANTHLAWWNTSWGVGNGTWAGAVTKVETELAYIGVTMVRDVVPASAGLSAEYALLGKAGIHFDTLQTVSNGTVALSSDIEAIATFNTANPGTIIAYEGANEYNTNSYYINNVGSYGNLAWGLLDAELTHTAMLANSVTASLPLIAPATANTYSPPSLDSYVSYSNWHVYGGVGAQLQNNLAACAALALATAPTHPIIFTEMGISSAAVSTSSWGVTGSAAVQGVIDINALLDAHIDGVSDMFLYNLQDDHDATDQSDNFGLFDAYGNAKAVATDLHNLHAILADTGSSSLGFTVGTLGYGISNLPATASSTLFEKSNGTYELVIWNGNATVMNSSGKAVTPATTQVTVNFASAHSTVNVYDPMQGTTAIQTAGGSSSVTVGLSTDPLIIEVD